MLNRLRLVLERRLSRLMAGPQAESRSKPVADDHELFEWRAQGNQYLANGNLSEAESCFRKALHFNANDTNTLTCLGYTLKALGGYAEARIHLRRAVALLGNVPEAHEATYLMGQIAEMEGDLQNARIQYLDVLRLKTDFSLACNDLCRLYKQMGLEDEIPKLLELCVTAYPEGVDYCYWYGNWLLEFKHYDAAICEFDKLIQFKPGFAEAHNNRGTALHEVDRSDEAIVSYNTAIQLNPDLAQAYSNRGAILMRRYQFNAAMANFRESIRLSPKSAIPHINIGEALRETRQLDDAIAHYDMAIQLDPNDPTAYWNKSLTLLLGGKFAEGFALYEYRYSDTRQDNKRDFVQARWQGQTSLQGKTILLHCEQGLGDTIQFCRYAPLVAAMGAKVILEVQKPLLRLLQGLQGVAQIVERENTPPTFDYHCPLLSLPHAFNTDENSVPRQESYLSVDAAHREKWRQKLGVKTKPRIGLVWSGNARHKNDHNRSLALSNLIETLPNCYRYISLQQEIRPTDQVALGNCTWIEHFGHALVDFADTAALCDLMDVVISVDTSVAHLAAGLGKPTWILLSYSVDWRWMLNRSDSPWYPSAKLYRQEHLGDWDDVLQKVGGDLRFFVDEKFKSIG